MFAPPVAVTGFARFFQNVSDAVAVRARLCDAKNSARGEDLASNRTGMIGQKGQQGVGGRAGGDLQPPVFLEFAKRAHDVDNVALTIMRTKLKAAGMLVLDALKEDIPAAPPAPSKPLSDHPAVKITAGYLPAADDSEDDDGVASLVARIPKNMWG